MNAGIAEKREGQRIRTLVRTSIYMQMHVINKSSSRSFASQINESGQNKRVNIQLKDVTIKRAARLTENLQSKVICFENFLARLHKAFFGSILDNRYYRPKKVERHKKPADSRGVLSSAHCDLNAKPPKAYAETVSDVSAVDGECTSVHSLRRYCSRMTIMKKTVF